MRTFLFQIPLIVAALASPHGTSINDQKNLGGLAVPDCFWDGTSPFCAGSCPSGYNTCATDSCGDGACCWTGYKKYCCRSACPSKLSIGQEPGNASGDVEALAQHHHKKNGPHDDWCDKGEQIYCPPEATGNAECICVKV